MPKIERKIPYTLAAYSGGIIKNNDKIERKKVSSTQDEMDIEPREESPIDPSMFVETIETAKDQEMNIESPETPPLFIDCDRAISPQPGSSSASMAVEQNPLSMTPMTQR